MILIAIIDDNRQERQALEEYVEHYLNEKNTAFLIHRYDCGVEFIRSRTVYDIVFMELQLSDMDGLDAARFLRIVNKNAKLVFVTHMAHLAIRGYEVSAVDFVVKPAEQSTIDRVMDKVLEDMEKRRGEYITLKTQNGVIALLTSSIYYVEVYDHDLVYHTDQGDHRVRGQLGKVREKLNDPAFVQCSRSYLVNMHHVQSVHSDYLMVNGDKIQIAKSHHKEIKERFLHYMDERG